MPFLSHSDSNPFNVNEKKCKQFNTNACRTICYADAFPPMLKEWECYGCWGVDTGRIVPLQSDLSVDAYYEDVFSEALSALRRQGSSTSITRPLTLKKKEE